MQNSITENFVTVHDVGRRYRAKAWGDYMILEKGVWDMECLRRSPVGVILPQTVFKSRSSEMGFPAFWGQVTPGSASRRLLKIHVHMNKKHCTNLQKLPIRQDKKANLSPWGSASKNGARKIDEKRGAPSLSLLYLAPQFFENLHKLIT